MEGAAPQNASSSRRRPRVDRRRKYPALEDQTTCLFQLPPLAEDQVLCPVPLQAIPPLTPGPRRKRAVRGPRHSRAVRGPTHPVHAQTPSDQPTGPVVGQVVEGVIDGKFQDGYLISVDIGGITMKGVAYGLVTNEPDPAPEGQTVQQNNNGVQESQRDDGKHISSQVEARTVRKIQPWSRFGNSGGGTSSKPTKHKNKDQDQARDVRGRGKGKA